MSDASRSRVTLFFSSGTFLGRKHDGIIASVEHRIAEWSQVPEENGEGLQILKYEHGEKYDGKRERMRVGAPPSLFCPLLRTIVRRRGVADSACTNQRTTTISFILAVLPPAATGWRRRSST